MIPDTSDFDKMAHIGAMTVLRKARREAALKLRDKLAHILSGIEGQETNWDVSAIVPLIDEIQAINQAIVELN